MGTHRPTGKGLSMQEQNARSKLSTLVSEQPFIKGCLVKRMLTCGNPNCKCAKGKKHAAYYLGVRYKDRRQMVQVPADWVPVISKWVETYQDMAALIEVVTAACIEKLMKGKATVANEG